MLGFSYNFHTGPEFSDLSNHERILNNRDKKFINLGACWENDELLNPIYHKSQVQGATYEYIQKLRRFLKCMGTAIRDNMCTFPMPTICAKLTTWELIISNEVCCCTKLFSGKIVNAIRMWKMS